MEKLNLLAALMRSYSLTSLKFDGIEMSMDPSGFERAPAQVQTMVIPPPDPAARAAAEDAARRAMETLRPLTDEELLLWSAGSGEVAHD